MGIVVAIDGPSGAGKSSTAKLIAHRAGWNYLDTGALYRGVTWLSLEKNEEDAHKLIDLLKHFPLKFNCDPQNPILHVGQTDVNLAIRSQQVTDRVSYIAAIPEIRKELLSIQRQYIKNAQRGIVVEGRDIGSVVAPESALKLFRISTRGATKSAITKSIVLFSANSRIRILCRIRPPSLKSQSLYC